MLMDKGLTKRVGTIFEEGFTTCERWLGQQALVLEHIHVLLRVMAVYFYDIPTSAGVWSACSRLEKRFHVHSMQRKAAAMYYYSPVRTS